MTMNDRLEQSVLAAQHSAPGTNERQLALATLTDEILRSRRICRSLSGRSLSGIFQEIYQAVRQQLLSQLEAQIDRDRSPSLALREWVSHLRDLAFRSVLSDDQLLAIALSAQRAPTPEQRQYALRELVEAIRLSDRLCRPHRSKFHPQFYELLYEEAVNQTLVYICQNIDKYDPTRSSKFMTWVNFRLDKLVIESRWEFSPIQTQEIPSLEDLENPINDDFTKDLTIEFEELIQADDHRLFQKEHIRDRPDANFRAIALATLQGKTWEELSQELDIKVSTLSSFFRRCCQKFSQKFKEEITPD
jgi:DNA-directed RNA polymerase specialized sigma24 family protein